MLRALEIEMAPTSDHSLRYFLSRITWMGVGPIVLFVLAIAILTSGSGWFTALDLAYSWS